MPRPSSVRLLPWVVGCLTAAYSLALAATQLRAADDASALPLAKVVLYNSGVGYFEHDASVEGDRQIDLKFNVEAVNDLLKSMVLQDLDGGKIASVAYGSRDPVTKTLRTFAIDLTSNPTLGDMLNQVRGERVEISAVGADRLQGVILGVEKRKEKVGDREVIEIEYLNLLTDAGLRSFALGQVLSIKLLNETLDRELRQALTVLALGHSTDKKTVSLNFVGQGKRRVRVGYIQESPIWKTSYRLVLADKSAPMLQGWAMAENTTEQDWKNVSLTLVSGRPISFVMNLYQPLYVPRPVVEPELFASLRPQTYNQDMEQSKREFAKLGEAQFGNRRQADAKGQLRSDAAAASNATALAGAPARKMLAADKFADRDADEMRIELQRGVASAANASDLGELFQYVIESPVTVPRQQSAMLPIVQSEVKADKLSIYNPQVHRKHPLNGLRLHNTTKLHLMQGPITVFDDGAYAGDARIEDLPPGSERLVSYAMDLDTEVALEIKGLPQELVSVRIVKGTVITSQKYRRSQTYTIKNSGARDRKVLVEYPFESNWKLTAPDKPTEKTRDMYRFAVDAAVGSPAKLTVDEEQHVQQQVAANNLDNNTIQLYTRAKVVGDNVKSALSEIVQRKVEIERVATQLQQTKAQIQSIGQEQDRIRQNMDKLSHTSELYQRYVKKFNDQEDQIEKLHTQAKQSEDQLTSLRRSLDEFLLHLDVS